MIELKINFTQIRNRVEAAANLQEAGEDDEAKAVIRKLAADILDRVKDQGNRILIVGLDLKCLREESRVPGGS